MIPDKIEIDLPALNTPENVDRRAHIAQLLRAILYSAEITPSANELGEWTLDHDWDPEFTKVTMKKVVHTPHRQG